MGVAVFLLIVKHIKTAFHFKHLRLTQNVKINVDVRLNSLQTFLLQFSSNKWLCK